MFIVNEREWRWVMKKLLLMIIALSFIAVVPKVASAFSILEDVNLDRIIWDSTGAQVDIVLSHQQAQDLGVSGYNGVQVSDDAMNTLSAALSLKNKKYIHCAVADTDNDGLLEMVAFSVGKNAIPQF